MEMAVISLVEEAIYIAASGEMGLLNRGEAGSSDWVPAEWEYMISRRSAWIDISYL